MIQEKSSNQSESVATLKNGGSVYIRPIRPDDDSLLVRIFNNCSPRTVYERFLTGVPELTPEMACYLSTVDHCNRLALIAETEIEPVGVARYEPTNDPGLVEVGMVVVDDWQNLGIGRTLLRELFRAAEGNGIHRFCAHVLGENRRMLRLLTTEGHIQDSKAGAGVTTVWFTARPPESFTSDARD
jgi:GNAT superfamily N-acetyltransferase